MSLELRKFVAPEFVFGLGALSLCGRYARNFGAKKVLIVSDRGVIDAGWVKVVQASLNEEGIEAAVFAEISPNPRAEEVMEGALAYQEEECDVIVAIGGGSPMDCAKGIGVVVTNHRHILDFEGIDQVPSPAPPLICLPTTAGSSADVSQFAIITDTREQVKKAIISKATVPDVALIDPETTLTMDNYLTACTGMDTLVHAIEAYVSTANSPIFDIHALEAIRLIGKYLESVIREPDNMEYRGYIMRASLEAGLAFSNASLGAVHAMAHSLGGYLDMPHGECNAILLSHVVAFNYSQAEDKYTEIGKAIGLDLTNKSSLEKQQTIIEGLNRIRRQVGITGNLGDRGAQSSDIVNLAQKAIQDPCMITNPRVPSQRDIEVLYEEAL
ncbi:alcohol dehydrogenase-like regulatory protein ErcA [Desulfopila sp. IMCC35008]|uniref:alcohol dehydrogenase-like regulatory protein ErcA n=1 Tax=Desulfopila sp. IMCC35008 TaxID=2653858 RepID=UPI0013D3B1C7|nr:alcohol dehydrogenase-like regulatory protein ErcA [Desulfopila sp. IMCC35008]